MRACKTLGAPERGSIAAMIEVIPFRIQAKHCRRSSTAGPNSSSSACSACCWCSRCAGPRHCGASRCCALLSEGCKGGWLGHLGQVLWICICNRCQPPAHGSAESGVRVAFCQSCGVMCSTESINNCLSSTRSGARGCDVLLLCIAPSAWLLL